MNIENNTAWIISCKTQASGWLVNGTMLVPDDPANGHCVKVLAWIADGNVPEPQYTDVEITAKSQAEVKSKSLTYLASTDWYITRHTELGTAVPLDVTTARAEARALISN